MTTIYQNTDLNDGVVNHFNIWETSVAKAFNVVIYTGNGPEAAYSVDDGTTFHLMNLKVLCAHYGQTPCCDQVVLYLPSINAFAWLVLTWERNVILSLASHLEIQDSKGQSWTSWLISYDRFGGVEKLFDQPCVSVGDNFLYITCNLGTVAIGMRIPLAQLQAKAPISFAYFVAKGAFYFKPAQSTGSTAYFATLLNDYKTLRVFSWPESSKTIKMSDVPIASIPTEDWVVQAPYNANWLSDRRGSLLVLGFARTGNELWAAWFANRNLIWTKKIGKKPHSFPYPHIGIAVVDLLTMRLLRQRYIWNPDHAFAFPDLATNASGDIGLSFCWGGGNWDPQWGVGMLTGPNQTLESRTSGDSVAAGGDYTTVRMSFPDMTNFCAAGFNRVLLPGLTNHPHYVRFGP